MVIKDGSELIVKGPTRTDVDKLKIVKNKWQAPFSSQTIDPSLPQQPENAEISILSTCSPHSKTEHENVATSTSQAEQSLTKNFCGSFSGIF